MFTPNDGKIFFSPEEFHKAFYPSEKQDTLIDSKEIGRRIGKETVDEVLSKIQIPKKEPTNKK
ncbi:MAG: hypothetical protein GYA12_02325 [Chloroflexi bacterium]|nr:hypothetical protein [Chloroflexota bacterium]BCY17208.1 hypothetical protein hrd7_10570 [Leptolinea sp. HRD-7]